jgi:hypothetical protein
MSNIIAGNGGGRGSAAAAITVALILMVSSPAILTTTEASAAPLKSKKDCNGIQIGTFEQSYFANAYSDRTVTIGTSQHEYSVKIDYFKVTNDDGYTYLKNVGAEDPKGRVLLPGGETITITLQTQQGLSHVGGHVFLYKHKVSDCQILLGHVQDKDKMDLKIVSVEQNVHTENAKITVQVPEANDVVGKHFTKLGIQFPLYPDLKEYHLISNRVQVS